MMAKAKGCFINNRWAETGSLLSVLSPWSGDVVGEVCLAGEAEWGQAIAAAQAAAEVFRKFSGYERREILEALLAGVRERQEEFAQTIMAEGGKPITYARAEMARGVMTLRLAAEEAVRLGGEVIPLDAGKFAAGRWGLTRRFPLGPVLGITPFNFPFNLMAHKVGPALAAGNPIIIKPASKTPLTALKLAEIYHEAGLPPGGFQVLPSPVELAERAAADDRLKALSFTGSAAVGWHLKNVAGRKRVLLELGGNAALIVDAGADLKAAAHRAAIGGFAHAGQICIAVQRLLVLEEIYEEFKEILLETVAREVITGDPGREETVAGPMIDETAARKVRTWVREAVDGGAVMLTGGLGEGSLIPPIVLENVSRDMKVWREEVFGPVVTLTPCRSFAEALALANDSVYGLQAGVFTNNLAHAWQAFETLEVGGVIINDAPIFRADHMPYGGAKASGLGREGVRYAMEELTELRLLALKV
ncbi:MAG: aldehyde dehydrogenase family protein [Deltaproteobacteria bacterium]|nr:aldehyde dehydrogenase family protein [Deltaproteobacteria bacterium]